MNPSRMIVAALSILLVSAAVSPATVTTFTPTADGMIYVNAPTSTSDGFSGPGNLDLYFAGGIPAQRDLFQFDLSSLAGATINSATFSVVARALSPRTNWDFEIYRMTSAWDATGKASWNNKSQDTDNSPSIQIPWTTAGGDFANSLGSQAFTDPYAALNGVTYNAFDAVSFSVTSLVQGWANGTFANDGLMLIQSTHPGEQAFFYSSDAVNDSSLWPSLTINFTPAVPEPASIGTTAFAVAAFCARRRVSR